MRCRHCSSTDLHPVIDLGTSPPSNAFPPIGTDPATEPRLPLRAVVCTECWLMQTEDVIGREELFCSESSGFRASAALRRPGRAD